MSDTASWPKERAHTGTSHAMTALVLGSEPCYQNEPRHTACQVKALGLPFYILRSIDNLVASLTRVLNHMDTLTCIHLAPYMIDPFECCEDKNVCFKKSADGTLAGFPAVTVASVSSRCN